MRQFYGTDLSPYSPEERSAISKATRYEINVYRVFLLWDTAVMLAGVLYVHFNAYWLTTYEILAVLSVVWGFSGMPFFLLRDIVVCKFAGRLPKPIARAELEPPTIPELVFKILAGFAIGAWATHVMIIYVATRHFQLISYSKNLNAK